MRLKTFMSTKTDQTEGGLASRQLRCFIAVAETLSFGKAADLLEVAQSGLSRQVKDLEARLGVRLLNRGRRSAVSLTEAGTALLREGLVGVRALDRAANSARQAARGQTGKVVIGFVASAALSGVLSKLLRTYREQYPQVGIDLEPMDSPAQIAALEDGSIDVGFLRPPPKIPVSIKIQIIHRDTMWLAFASEHPLAKKRIEPQHLSQETFIVPQFEEGSAFANQLAQIARAGSFEPRKIIHVKDFLVALTLAAAGYGTVPVPKSTLAINLPHLMFKQIQGKVQSVELAVAYSERRTSPAVAALVRNLTRLDLQHAP